MKKTIRVPATTANLGPGFDSLGLALALWNQAEVSLLPEGAQAISVEGYGAGELPETGENLVLRASSALFAELETPALPLHFRCRNLFPASSGLGSSSSAILMGLAGANAFVAEPMANAALLDLANRLEGHPDNVTPALLGGLTLSAIRSGPPARVLAHKVVPARGWRAGVVVPELAVGTAAMRAALPLQVPFGDAVFNLSRAVLVVEAFKRGDLALLLEAMEDRLHQPSRLPHIPGASEALEAARGLGLPAALSGAGPGVVAFALNEDRAWAAVRRMAAAFEACGVQAWRWVGEIDLSGTRVI